MLRRTATLLLGIAIATLSTGCLTFQTRQPVFTEGGVSVFLRSDSNMLGRTHDKTFAHPVTVSNIRLTHILSRLDLRTEVKKGNKRQPVIPTELLAPIAQGVSQALSKADTSQEIVVMAFRNDHSFGVFDKRYLTSLLVHARGDQLFLFVDKSDQQLDKRQEKKPPEPRSDMRHSRFRLHPGESMTLIDSQTVAVAWRSSLFSRPTRTKILPSGQVVRKTILMEEAPDLSVDDPANPGLPGGLSPTQLRALADLEEARQRGELTEGQYQTRRAVILSGS